MSNQLATVLALLAAASWLSSPSLLNFCSLANRHQQPVIVLITSELVGNIEGDIFVDYTI